MTVLDNSIRIQAPPEQVWLVLGKLDASSSLRPGRSQVRDSRRPSTGIGPSRQCDLAQFGPVGKLMDAMMVRKKWNQGIQGFFAGLKRFVEKGGKADG